MALVMIGGRYLLGEREPWVLLLALLGIGAISFVGTLWVFDRGLMLRRPALRQAGRSGPPAPASGRAMRNGFRSRPYHLA